MTKPITKPGVYDIDIDLYHTDCCPDISLSSGDLVAITKNPAKWFAFHWSNPDAYEREDKTALAIGRAAHAIVCEGSLEAGSFIIRPDEFDSYRTKASKEWRDEAIANGQTPLTPDDVTLLTRMANAIAASPEARHIFELGRPEQTLVWKRDDVWLKGRPDVIPVQDPRIICDYKTVASLDTNRLTRAITDFGWAQKLANVADGMINCVPTGAKEWHDFDFVLICQEKSPPYEVACVTIPHHDIADLFRVNRAAIAEFKQSRESGIWRGQHDGFVEYNPGDWMLNHVAKRYGGLNGLPAYENIFETEKAA